MRDLERDWRRWTAAERVFAAGIAVVLMLGVPALVVIELALARA